MPDQWNTGIMKGQAMDANMPPNKPASAPTHTRQRIVWLVVVHIVMGLTGAFVAYLLALLVGLRCWETVFVCLVFSQTSLLGIWGGLGTSPWWKRLTGVLVGISYLVPLLGIGIHEVNSRRSFSSSWLHRAC